MFSTNQAAQVDDKLGTASGPIRLRKSASRRPRPIPTDSSDRIDALGAILSFISDFGIYGWGILPLGIIAGLFSLPRSAKIWLALGAVFGVVGVVAGLFLDLTVVLALWNPQIDIRGHPGGFGPGYGLLFLLYLCVVLFVLGPLLGILGGWAASKIQERRVSATAPGWIAREFPGFIGAILLAFVFSILLGLVLFVWYVGS